MRSGKSLRKAKRRKNINRRKKNHECSHTFRPNKGQGISADVKKPNQHCARRGRWCCRQPLLL
uniref:Uncharacterized protein n=1 Tax=Los Azufres archaeal virus 2 TaxID=1425359 RepID=A0A0A0P537_9VIRU|nr:hypothetical protein [Los Azufres archaeal virus 2]